MNPFLLALAICSPPQIDPDAERLIGQLTQLDNSANFYAFPPSVISPIRDRRPVNSTVAELVHLGVRALPSLLAHLTDKRETDMKVEGARFFGGAWFSNEYDRRFADPAKTSPNVPASPDLRKDIPSSGYKLRVGDLCYSLIGQIVNRNLKGVRGQPTNCTVINSPIETPALADATRADWSGLTEEQHIQSLEDDVYGQDMFRGDNAVVRLLDYYPQEGKKVVLQLLSRQGYIWEPVRDFISKSLVVTDTPAQWKTIPDRASKLFGPAVASEIPCLIYNYFLETSQGTPTWHYQAKKLFDAAFPDFKPYARDPGVAGDCTDQYFLVTTLRGFKGPWIDDAVAAMFQRAVNMPGVLKLENYGFDDLAEKCFDRLKGKGHDEMFKEYFVKRLDVLRPRPRYFVANQQIAELREKLAELNPALANDLLAQSHLVVEPHGWTDFQASVARYVWYSPTQILHWEGAPYVGSSPDLALYDIQTGKTQELPELSMLSFRYKWALSCEVSPNGKWLLFSGYKDNAPEWFACHLDGSGLRSWPRHAVQRMMDSEAPSSLAHWTMNGSNITETEPFDTKKGLTVQVWNRPFPVVNKERTYSPVNANMGYDWVNAYDTGGDQMVAVDEPQYMIGGPPKSIPIYLWVNGEPGTLRSCKVNLPDNTDSIWEISPDRTKILWEFRQGMMWSSNQVLPVTDPQPRPKPSGPQSLSLWVSDFDGRNLRMIGQIPVTDDWQSGENQQFGEFHWLPDSKNASFIYFGKLYQLSAE